MNSNTKTVSREGVADLLSPENFITVIETPEPVGKHIILNEHDEPVKDHDALGIVSNGTATTLSAATSYELAEIIRDVGNHVNKVLILSHLKGTIPGDTYKIVTVNKMKQMGGDGTYKRDGILYATRTKDNFIPSNWILFDRDITEGMPKRLRNLDEDRWLDAMGTIFPGFADAARVVVPSTTGQVLYNGVPMEASGSHIYVRVCINTGANSLPKLGQRLLAAALGNNLGFMKVNKNNAKRAWSIFDPTTFSPERLVFDGKPRVSGDKLSVDDPVVVMIEGNELDPTRIVSLSTTEKKAILRRMGLAVEGNSFVSNELNYQTFIETKDHGTITLKELLMLPLPENGKFRTQVPFRPESQSMNGFVALDAYDCPFLYDNGMRIRYQLEDPEPMREGPNQVKLENQKKYSYKDAATYMNERFFVAPWGGNITIVDTQARNAMNEVEPSGIKPLGFRTLFRNRTVGAKNRELNEWWLNSHTRREYNNVIFDPAGQPGENDARDFNLWTGFAIQPVMGDWSLIKKHIELLCSLDENAEELAEYVINWIAYLVQSPGTPHGTSIAFMDEKGGTGKSLLIEVVSSFFGKHAMLATTPKQLVGDFNKHLVNKVFIGAEEVAFAGDHRATEIVKNITTAKTMVVEPKGVDAYVVPNRLSLMMTTNQEWVVRVDNNSRRNTVIEVPTAHSCKDEYFIPLIDQINNGGSAAMLFDLLAKDITDFQSHKHFITGALHNQVELSLEPLPKLICDMAEVGTYDPDSIQDSLNILVNDDLGGDVELSLLYEIYKRRAGRYPMSLAVFSRTFTKLTGIHSTRRTVERGGNGEHKKKVQFLHLDEEAIQKAAKKIRTAK